MARIRSINPCAPLDEDVATMSIGARLLWAFLPCHADRDGRLRDSAFTLKTQIMPADPVDVEALLAELAERRHIIRYEVDGRRYIQIRNFRKHQNPHKNETPSIIPPINSSAAPAGRTKSVYFIRNDRSGDIKIGHAFDVEARLAKLQTGSSDPLSIVAIMRDGKEAEIHALFEPSRKDGEWFRPSEELLEFIEEYSISADDIEERPVTPGNYPSEPTNAGVAPAIPDPIPDPSPDPSPSPDLLSHNAREEPAGVPDQSRPPQLPSGRVKGHGLAQMFGIVRAREVTGAIPWHVPKDRTNKADAIADAIADDPAARADVIPSMVLFFQRAKAGEIGQGGKAVSDPSYGFACWVSAFTALREALSGNGPALPPPPRAAVSNPYRPIPRLAPGVPPPPRPRP